MSRFLAQLGNAGLPPGEVPQVSAHHVDSPAFKDALKDQGKGQTHDRDGHMQHHPGPLHRPFRQARRSLSKQQSKPQSVDIDGPDGVKLVTGLNVSAGIPKQRAEDLGADDASGDRRLAKQREAGQGGYYRNGSEKLGGREKLLGWIDPGIPIGKKNGGQKNGGQKRRGGNPEDEAPERLVHIKPDIVFSKGMRPPGPPPPRRSSI